MTNRGEIPDLTGEWHSWYRYYSGTRQEEFEDEHTVTFVQKGSKLTGTNLPDESGSRLRLDLEVAGQEVNGRWKEKTSPSGYYEGRQLRGVLSLILDIEATRMHGKWLGAASDHRFVNVGEWSLERV